MRIVGKNQNLWHVDAFLHWGELRHQFRDMFACRVKGMVDRLKEMVNVYVFAWCEKGMVKRLKEMVNVFVFACRVKKSKQSKC